VKNNYGIPQGPTVQLSQNNKRRKPTFQTFTTVDDSPWLDSFMAMEVWSPGPPRLWLVAVEVIDSHGVTQLCAVLHGHGGCGGRPSWPTASMEDLRGSFFFFEKKIYMWGWLYFHTISVSYLMKKWTEVSHLRWGQTRVSNLLNWKLGS